MSSITSSEISKIPNVRKKNKQTIIIFKKKTCMQKILHAKKKKKTPTKQDIYLLKTYFCTFLQAEPQSRI